jgi:hypothetical protein
MKVLIACEFSGKVRDAFRAKGHEAFSCDLEPSTDNSPFHIQDDVLELIYGDRKNNWDLMIAHPPCTFLCVTGNKWMKDEYKERFPTRQQDRKDAIEFFLKLWNAPIPKIAIENPVGIMSTVLRPPDQYVHPYMFGEPYSKKTGLWLKNLPKLNPTNIVDKGQFTTYKSGKKCADWYSTDCDGLSMVERQRIRNTTFQGLADAFADQWNN